MSHVCWICTCSNTSQLPWKSCVTVRQFPALFEFSALFECHPNMTFAVGCALKTNYLSVCLLSLLCFSLSLPSFPPFFLVWVCPSINHSLFSVWSSVNHCAHFDATLLVLVFPHYWLLCMPALIERWTWDLLTPAPSMPALVERWAWDLLTPATTSVRAVHMQTVTLVSAEALGCPDDLQCPPPSLD